MEDKYKRLTTVQVELWLNDPATKAYLVCIGLEMERVEGELENGSWIDPTNNDLTSWNLSNHRAQIEAYDLSFHAEELFYLKGAIERRVKQVEIGHNDRREGGQG